jgi:16S rRNA (guanine966-N2)-methyltransferase
MFPTDEMVRIHFRASLLFYLLNLTKMRIISGLAKGRKLFTPAGQTKEIRPTSDRAREALFSILGPRVLESRVLDLFAGTGALGCEALSRGAESVTFVDMSTQALALIKKNIPLIPDGVQRSTVIQHDLRGSLPFPSVISADIQPFDLIFADPPYGRGFTEKILILLDKSIVLSQKVLIIIEELKGVDLDIKLDLLSLDKKRCYGDTCFHFFIHKQ